MSNCGGGGIVFRAFPNIVLPNFGPVPAMRWQPNADAAVAAESACPRNARREIFTEILAIAANKTENRRKQNEDRVSCPILLRLLRFLLFNYSTSRRSSTPAPAGWERDRP
jgi:hypothetical protein